MINSSRWVQVLIIELVIIASLYLLQLVGGFLMQFSGIWLLFFLSWLIAFALRPPIRGLARVGVPQPLAVLVVYIALVMLFVAGGIVLFPQLTAQLTALQNNWDNYVTQANLLVIDLERWVEQNTGQEIDLNSMYREATAQIQAQAGTILSNALSWLSTAASLAFNFILVILISLYIALDGERLGNSLVRALPRTWRDEAILVGESIGRSFGGFLRGQVIFAAIYGVLNAGIMAFFGLDYVLIVSIICGFCMLIPLLGNFLAYAPPVIVALINPATSDRWWQVFLAVIVMQAAMMQAVGPRIMSSAVGIHPLFTVGAMLMGAQMMGVWGALFGIPVAGVIGLVAAAFLNRLKTFFSTPEPTPVLGMVMTPAPAAATGPLDGGMVEPEPDEPAATPATATTVLGPAPTLEPSTRPPALLRGLNWLAATARRGVDQKRLK
jgi:predicted PurR-regulated permease PerM